MKNWELTNAIVKNFYSSLTVHESYILHQDFAHYFTPWIHLLQWQLRDYFEFVQDIKGSNSIVYKYVKKIPEDKLNLENSFENFSDEDIDNAFDYSISLVSDEKYANIYAAKVMCYIHQRQFTNAEKCFQSIVNTGVTIDKDLLIVKEIIESGKF